MTAAQGSQARRPRLGRAREGVREATLAVAREPLALAAIGCILLGTLSLPLGFGISEDPWAWLVWGRELLHGTLHTAGGGSWKPLPVLFTGPFAVFGAAAPSLWLVAVRAAGLMSCVLAARIASRLAGPVAGVIAAVGQLLIASWLRYWGSGISELIVVALLLGAIEAHMRRRHAVALLLIFGAGLGRPEAWLFLLAYGALMLWRREQRALVVATFVAIPVLWFVPDLLSSGNAAKGAALAESGLGNRTTVVISRSLGMLVPAVKAATLVAVAIALVRRDRRVITLAALGLAWAVIVLVMNKVGFAGLRRFMLPAAALATLLAGVGIASAAALVARGNRVVYAIATVAMIAVAVPFAMPKPSLRSQYYVAKNRGKLVDGLNAMRRRVGGTAAITACGRPGANSATRTALAWDMGVRLSVPVSRVRGHGTFVIFAARRGRGDSTGPPAVDPGMKAVRIQHGPRWSAFVVVSRGVTMPAACRALGADPARLSAPQPPLWTYSRSARAAALGHGRRSRGR